MKRRGTSFFEKDSDVEELIEILKCKFGGNLTRAWRTALDTDQSGLLDFREFSSALKDIGYVGNMRTLWFNLDDDQSGSISLKELDPVAYYSLEKFRVLANRQYGTIQNCWNKLLDEDRSGTVSFEEFFQAVTKLGYESEEEVHELFDYLLSAAVPGMRYIAIHDIEFLQVWEDQKKLTAFRKRLPSAWVNRDPYLTPSKAGSVMTSNGVLTANPSLTTLGTSNFAEQSVEEDYGNMVSHDEEGQKQAFRDFLIEKFGTLPKAFDAMDANGSGSLSLTEFSAVVSTVLRFCRPSDAGRLFLTFNKDPGAMLTWDELGIQRHEWLNHLMERRTARQRKEAERRGDGSQMLGSSPRQQKCFTGHVERLRNVQKRSDVAFGSPLPKGWGFPPYFDSVPRRHDALPPLSAR